MINPVIRPLSVEEYLEREQGQPVRHEYLDGYLYAMAGASARHSRITGNVFATLWPAANARNCRVHHSDMKLRLGRVFYYPDVMAVCTAEPPHSHYETDPCLLVEVLSPSTKDNDLREKMLEYRRIAALQTYLVIDPDSLFVRHIHRDAEGNWRQEDLTGSADIALPCLGTTLTLGQVYLGVF